MHLSKGGHPLNPPHSEAEEMLSATAGKQAVSHGGTTMGMGAPVPLTPLPARGFAQTELSSSATGVTTASAPPLCVITGDQGSTPNRLNPAWDHLTRSTPHPPVLLGLLPAPAPSLHGPARWASPLLGGGQIGSNCCCSELHPWMRSRLRITLQHVKPFRLCSAELEKTQAGAFLPNLHC